MTPSPDDDRQAKASKGHQRAKRTQGAPYPAEKTGSEGPQRRAPRVPDSRPDPDDEQPPD